MSSNSSPCISVLQAIARQVTFVTHLDHIFFGIPDPLVPGICMPLTNLIQDAAFCTCPDHLSRWMQRTAVISSMPSFWGCDTEGVLSRPLVGDLLQVKGVWSPRFITVRHSRTDISCVHLAAHPRGLAVGTGKSFPKQFHEAENGLHIKHGAIGIHLSNWSVIMGRVLLWHLGQT